MPRSPRYYRKLLWGPVAWAGVVACAPSTHGSPVGPEIQLLAVSGQPPAGSIDAEHFVRFDGPPVINNAAQVAFLAGPAPQDDHPLASATSVWLSDEYGSQLVAADPSLLPADTTPAQPRFERFAHPVLNDAGAVLFHATLQGTGAASPQPQGIWRSASGDLQMVAQTHAAAPGFDGRPFHSFSARSAFATDGSFAFYGKVGSTSGGNALDGGLWVGDGEILTLAAGASRIAATPGGQDQVVSFDAQTFGTPFSDHPVIAEGGRTAFQAFMEGPLDHRFSVWTYHAAEGLQRVVQTGDAAPGIGARAFVSFPAPPEINNRGDVTLVAFDGPSSQSPGTLDKDDVDLADLALGVWSTRSGSLAAVVRQGDHPAGMDGSAVFVDFANVLMNGRSDVAVMGVVDVPALQEQSVVGIWSDGTGAAGELQAVAHSGLPAPGTPAGVVFHSFLEPAINNTGQVAFLATLAGPGVSDANGNVLGLWGQDRSGRLRLVTRSGGQIAVAEEDWRTIEAIDFAAGSGGQDGRPRGLNDRGQIAFRVRLTDGSSAVVLSNTLRVPEPSAGSLATLIALLPALRAGQRMTTRRVRATKGHPRERAAG